MKPAPDSQLVSMITHFAGSIAISMLKSSLRRITPFDSRASDLIFLAASAVLKNSAWLRDPLGQEFENPEVHGSHAWFARVRSWNVPVSHQNPSIWYTATLSTRLIRSGMSRASRRSEEHTSELQSQSKLRC